METMNAVRATRNDRKRPRSSSSSPPFMVSHPSLDDRLRYLWYEGSYWLSAAALTIGFSLRVEGGRNVPADGPVLLVANHQSFVDPTLVGLATRRHLHYLARKTLFVNPVLGWLIRSVNAVPVDQEGFAREGLKTMIELLQAGHAVVVFPEGERTSNGVMQPFRPGVTLLLKKAPRLVVVPVGIAGAYDAWPRWRALPIPAPLFWPANKGTIGVSIGKPLDSQLLANRPREDVLDVLLREIQKVQDRAEHLRRK